MSAKVQLSFSNLAQKQIKKLPAEIFRKLKIWMTTIDQLGIHETRKISGYHDEALKGRRAGQRSVRLNKSYRIIYEETVDGLMIYISVIEVNKHEY